MTYTHIHYLLMQFMRLPRAKGSFEIKPVSHIYICFKTANLLCPSALKTAQVLSHLPGGYCTGS